MHSSNVCSKIGKLGIAVCTL